MVAWFENFPSGVWLDHQLILFLWTQLQLKIGKFLTSIYIIIFLCLLTFTTPIIYTTGWFNRLSHVPEMLWKNFVIQIIGLYRRTCRYLRLNNDLDQFLDSETSLSRPDRPNNLYSNAPGLICLIPPFLIKICKFYKKTRYLSN